MKSNPLPRRGAATANRRPLSMVRAAKETVNSLSGASNINCVSNVLIQVNFLSVGVLVLAEDTCLDQLVNQLLHGVL